MSSINEKIKTYRIENGFTQAEMARKLGISQPAYHKIEVGKSDSLRVETLKNFCIAFNLSADKLLELGEYKQEPTQIINIFSRNSAAISNGSTDDKE